MLFFLNTFDKHFPLKNKSLLTIFSSTMILSSRIYSVPPLFLPERIPLHTMRYHLIVTYPNQTSDTQSHKVAMFSKQSFFGWNRCISPQLPSVPMQTNQSSVSLPSTHLFFIKQRATGGEQSRPIIHVWQTGITIQHIPFFIFTYHLGANSSEVMPLPFALKTTIKSLPDTLVFTGLQPRPNSLR